MQYGAAIHRVLQDLFRFRQPGAAQDRRRTDRSFPPAIWPTPRSRKRTSTNSTRTRASRSCATSSPRRAPCRRRRFCTPKQSFEIHVGETTVVGRIDRIDRRPDGTRRHRRLQDRQGPRSGRCRREPAAVALRHRCARKVGIQRRRADLLQPGRKCSRHHHAYRSATDGARASRVEAAPPGNRRRDLRSEARHPLQFLRLSKSLSREGEAHSANPVAAAHAEFLRDTPRSFSAFSRLESFAVLPKNLGDALERPLFTSYMNFLNASFSSLPFSWLPLFLFSLPFFMENVAVVFYCN